MGIIQKKYAISGCFLHQKYQFDFTDELKILISLTRPRGAHLRHNFSLNFVFDHVLGARLASQSLRTKNPSTQKMQSEHQCWREKFVNDSS